LRHPLPHLATRFVAKETLLMDVLDMVQPESEVFELNRWLVAGRVIPKTASRLPLYMLREHMDKPEAIIWERFIPVWALVAVCRIL
jgi:hypothetical protein